MSYELDPEAQLLAVCILNPHRIAETPLLEADDFLDPVHGLVFGRIRDLYNSGLTCSCYELPNHFTGILGNTEQEIKSWFFFMARSCVECLVDVPSLVRTIRYNGLKKKLDALLDSAKGSKKAAEPLILELQIELEALSIRPDNLKNASVFKVGQEVLDDMASEVKVYPSGLELLDRAMGGGFFAGKCYGFAGRKKSAKTALMATLAHNLNLNGHRTLFIALEMGRKEIMHRIIARGLNEAPLGFLTAKKRDVDFQKRVEEFISANPKNLHFIDRAGIGFKDLQRELLLQYRKLSPEIIILDYWQLVMGKDNKQSTAEHLDNVAQYLASFAKQYGVAVIVTSQINQEGNTRGSEGMRLAFDQVFQLHRLGETEPKFWLEMMDTRYTIWHNIGSEDYPTFSINPNGVYFEEIQ